MNKPEINSNSFRLKRFWFKRHPILGEKDFKFIDDEESSLKESFTSIIIGINGSGKSQTLKYLVNVFREIESISRGKKEINAGGDYYLEYLIGNDYYKVSNNPLAFTENKLKNHKYLLNEKNINDNELKLPSSLLAISVLLNDNFPFFDSEENSFYQYLGIRRSSSQAGTRTFIKKIVENLINSINKPNFNQRILKVLDLLGFKDQLFINYYSRYKTRFFNGNLTIDEFDDFFINWSKYNRKYEPWSLSNYRKLSVEEKNEVVSFANKVYSKLNIERRHKNGIFQIDILNDIDAKYLLEMSKMLNSLDMMSFPSINIRKINKKQPLININSIHDFRIMGQVLGFPIENSSSGEFHLFSSFIGILATIGSNSIVLLDEPEISLHPNWQMQYIDTLKKVFSDYPGCHFLIATHSHFLISDLKPESSSIISMQSNENGNFDAIPIEANTYGWSAEEILFKVFRLRSARNYSFEISLRELLHHISKKSGDRERIKELIIFLKQSELDKNDPLTQILKEADEYVRGL